ncbi:MAG: hypothetical protein IKK01_01190 [Clostridia bacterium]|nr:hypothetical protein [Clostridia bacterium]
MIIKQTFALLFALIMAFSLASCGGGGEVETSAPEITADLTESTAEAVDLDLHIVQDGASEYVLVRSETGQNDVISAMQKLRNTIKDKYGISLKLDTDGKRKPGTDPEYQILIGATKEPESANAAAFISSLSREEASFVIETHEKRLVIVATNEAMYDAALKYLEENFMTDKGMTVPIGFKHTAEIETLTLPIFEPGNELEVSMKELYTITPHTDANGVKCRIIQGACTDGEYLYTCLNDGASSGAVTTIVKTELVTGNVVAKYENIMIDHANDLTYNPKTKEILACHNSPRNQLISIFDAETMEYKETKTIRHQIYSIEYDEFEDCYWVGISGSYDFVRYDGKLKKYDTQIHGFENGFTKQGMDADDKYVFFVLYKTNCIAVYNKEGEYIRQIDLPVTKGEPENISHVGDTFYIVYNNPSWTGGIVYEVKITEKK